MKSSAHIFFHEMTHLTVIEGTNNGKWIRPIHLYSSRHFMIWTRVRWFVYVYEVVVKDLLSDPVTPGGLPTYGPRLCEKLAARFPSFAGNNGTQNLLPTSFSFTTPIDKSPLQRITTPGTPQPNTSPTSSESLTPQHSPWPATTTNPTPGPSSTSSTSQMTPAWTTPVFLTDMSQTDLRS